MSLFSNMKTSLKRVKGAEWAVLLIVLGLAGSLLLSPGATDWISGAANTPTSAKDDSLEGRLASILSSMEGAGKVDVVIHYSQPVMQSGTWLDTAAQSSAEPVSVIVVAEGAGDLMVRLEIARAVQTLLRLDADAVEIFKMHDSEKGE